MRCSECDGIVRKPSVGRLRDGRIVFGWCEPCMDIAGALRVELTDRVHLFGTDEKITLPLGGTSWDNCEAGNRKRILALTITAASLAVWGLTMSVVGFSASDEPTPANPRGTHTGLFLVAGGGSLIGTALGLFLAARKASRNRPNGSQVAFGNPPQPLKSETAW